jgi:hypothetical protein
MLKSCNKFTPSVDVEMSGKCPFLRMIRKLKNDQKMFEIERDKWRLR